MSMTKHTGPNFLQDIFTHSLWSNKDVKDFKEEEGIAWDVQEC